MEKPPGTYCVLPWNSVNIRNNGDLRLCCNANSYSPKKGILTKEDGTPYNAGVDDWNEARNSQMIKDVRVAMMNGEWHPECERCKQEESAGQTSRRMFDTKTWAQLNSNTTFESVLPNTLPDGTIDTDSQDIEFVDIRYGNFCNLKCRMCGPTDSHSWYEDFTKLYNTEEFDDTHGTVYLTRNEKGRLSTSDYDWFVDNEQYIENFEKYAKNAKRLYIVGGEPLIIKEHTDTLKKLVESGASIRMELEYNTNLTNVTPVILELWSKFKTIRLGASIDGFGDVFDYQRYPAKWESVYENIKNIDAESSANVKAWFSFTVTNINVFHLPDFMKWKLVDSGLTRFNALGSHKPVTSFHMCHGPARYNVRSLPAEMKQLVSSRYDEYRKWINASSFDDHVKKHFLLVLESVEKFMYAKDMSENFTNKNGFVNATRKLDELRNQNILDIVPEYEKYFK